MTHKIFKSDHTNRVAIEDDTFKYKPVLDYILAQGGENECPYIKVSIYDIEIHALLDSGANAVFLGKPGWNLFKKFNLNCTTNNVNFCTLPNDLKLNCIGTVHIPIKLKDRTKIFEVYVVPDLKHTLIVGTSFWVRMGIIPDLRKGEWHFSSEPQINFISHSLHLETTTDLSVTESSKLVKVLNEYFESIKNIKLGCTNLVKHKITTSSPPIKSRYYPVSPHMQKLIDAELDKMLQLGVVEKSTSGWSSPILMIPKKDKTYRFCVDFRKLNAVSDKCAYPIPYISSILDKLGNARYLSTLDIRSAYWQIPLEENSKKYTAFTIPGRGLFQFCRMPFGLHGAPATFQALVDKIFGPELEPYLFKYLDDIIIATPDFETHLKILKEVFTRLKTAGLTLQKDKCIFCRDELKFLGYIINRAGLNIDPDKISAIVNIPTPKNVKEVRRIVGMMSWYRKFVPNFSHLIAPLTNLTKKGKKFVWSLECEKSLITLKECLINPPILACPSFEHQFILQCDASSYGLGAVLSQNISGEDRVICYLSRSLTSQEKKYTTTERECLSVLWAIEKLRCYLEQSKFTVITDHYSLVWLNNLKDPQGRLGRWVLRLQQYDFEIIHRKGKEHVVPDCLSRAVPIINNMTLNEGTNDKWYEKMCERVRIDPLKFKEWRVCDQKLYKYVKGEMNEVQEEENKWKLVIAKKDRKELLKQSHDNVISGHLGVYKTYNRLLTNYYWPGMQRDVRDYVRKCTVCARYKPVCKKTPGEMGKRPNIERCWQLISVDLVGPLPRSKKGNFYILVVTDYFSKFSLFFPIKKATSSAVIKIMEDHIFLLFGVPEFLIADNGKQFTSREFQNLLKEYGVQPLYNASYHPQNNPTERVNRVIKTMIASYIEKDQRDWDLNLSKLGCAIRTAKHEVVGHTPYYINYGKEMITNGHMYEREREKRENVGESAEVDVNTEVSNRSERLRKLKELVKNNLSEAHFKSKNRYDLRHRPMKFSVGDRVWKREYHLSNAANYFTSKLGEKFSGPYTIKKILGLNVYKLLDEKGKDKGNWHIKDLKLYNS